MRAAVVLGVVAALLFVPGPARAGDDECPAGQIPQSVPGHGSICVVVTDPGGHGTGDPGGTSPTHGTGVALCTFAAQQIPCVTGDGVWFASHQCYAQSMQPQPSVGSPAWQGHSPDEGQVWVCATYLGPATGGYWFFVANGETPALVDPADLAANAVGQLHLAVADIHMAPEPPELTYVGLETWLWIEPTQWVDLSLTVAAGGTSVTVVARPAQVTWDLTEGSTKCQSAGRAWEASMSSAATTDCSYTFRTVSSRRAGGSFAVNATISYDVDWTCAGACLVQAGSLGRVDGLPGSSAIRVSERQSVVIGGRLAS